MSPSVNWSLLDPGRFLCNAHVDCSGLNLMLSGVHWFQVSLTQAAICSLVESPLWEMDMESLILELRTGFVH